MLPTVTGCVAGGGLPPKGALKVSWLVETVRNGLALTIRTTLTVCAFPPLVGVTVMVAVYRPTGKATGETGDTLTFSVAGELGLTAPLMGETPSQLEFAVCVTLNVTDPEVELTVDAQLTLAQAHEVAHHAEEHLLVRVKRLTAATVHTSPAGAH